MKYDEIRQRMNGEIPTEKNNNSPQPPVSNLPAVVSQQKQVPHLPAQGRGDILSFQSFESALNAAKFLAGSALVPKGYRDKPADILLAWQFGAEVGLRPMQALTSVAVIQGKPGLYGDSLPAIAQAHPSWRGMEEMDLKEIEKKGEATCTVYRAGCPVSTYTFTRAMAKKAGLLNKPGPWQQYQARMLQLRARNFALRAQYADVLSGFHSIEELQDYPQKPPKIKPQKEVITIEPEVPPEIVEKPEIHEAEIVEEKAERTLADRIRNYLAQNVENLNEDLPDLLDQIDELVEEYENLQIKQPLEDWLGGRVLDV